MPNATSTNTPTSGGTATATATPGGEPRDSDGDGYPDQEEIDMGDNPNVYCDTRRADVNDDGFVNTVDLAMLGHHFLEPVPPPTPGYVDPMPTRLDQNRDGMINVIDVAMVGKHFLHDVHECH